LNAASGTSNIPVGNQYVTGDPKGEFTYSPDAFTGENRILGIGVQGLPGSNVSGFTPTVKFALGDNTYSAATSVPGTDGRVSFSLYSHPGDFTVQFQPVEFAGSQIYRPSNITFRGNDGNVYTLPGGIGSGASYDFAFRAIPLTSSNSYQMFFDLTAMERLYRNLTEFQTHFNRTNVLVAPGTNYYGQGIGTIGSTVTIAINGLSNNTAVISVPPPRIPVEVLVDTSRDGYVNALDVSWKDQWTNTRGAIFVVNYDANGKLANDKGIPVPDSINFGNDGAPDFEDYVINGPEDTKDIAPLKIRAMPNLPKDYRVFLAVEEEEDMRAVHFFKKIADGERAIWGGALVAGKAPPWTDGDEELKDIEITRWVNPNMVSSDPEKKYQETREPTNDPYYTFGVEGLLLRGMKCPGGTLKDQPGRFSGEIVVGVEIRTPTGQVVGKDTVRMRVAPWLALSREQAAEEIWAVDVPGFPASEAFLRQPFQKPHYSGLNNMGQVLKTFIADLALNQGNQWFQDHVEIGYTQMPGRPPKHLVFRLPYFYTKTQSQPMWPVLSLLKLGVGCFQLGDKLFDNANNERESGDYGGNIELLPPNNNRPLGTLMLGNTVSAELARFFKAQEFQWDAGLSASTPVDWLEVGHIDEVTSFLSGGRVLLADSHQAIELLEAKFPAADQDARARAVFFAKTKQAAPANGDLPAPITQLGQLTEDYDPVNAPGILRTGIDHRNGPQFQYIRFYSGGSQGHVAKVKMDNQFVQIVKGEDDPKTPGNKGGLLIWATGPYGDHSMEGYEKSTREVLYRHFAGTPPKKNDKFVFVEDTVFWSNPGESLVADNKTIPAVITVKEILDDPFFVGRNRKDIKKLLDDVRTAIASTPGGNTLRFIPVPALFFSNGSAFNPGPTNLQFAANQVYAPRQFAPASGNQRDIFEEVIKNTIPELFRFVDDWELYHCGVGEVHCGTAEKRVLPQNRWWTTLP
jgi:hypothetical protein